MLSQVVCIFSSFPIQITTQRHYRTAQLMSQKQPSCAAGDSQLVSQKQPSCAAGDSQLMSQKQPSCTAGNSQLISQNVRPVQRETHSWWAKTSVPCSGRLIADEPKRPSCAVGDSSDTYPSNPREMQFFDHFITRRMGKQSTEARVETQH